MDTSPVNASTEVPPPKQEPASLWQLVRYFLRLGTLGFGGPVALVGLCWLHGTSVHKTHRLHQPDFPFLSLPSGE